MRRILITRPELGALRIADRLAQQGHEILIEPLLTIKPVASTRPYGPPPDVVMLTSGNALWPFTEKNEAIRDLLDIPCFCVGPHTAVVACETGFTSVAHGMTDVEDLVAFMREKLVPGQRILHLCGEGQRSMGAQLLLSHGFLVSLWPTYRAEAATSFSGELKESLTQKKLDSALFFSPRTASLFVKLVTRSGLQSSCEDMTAFGLSQAVADRLRPVVWREVRIAALPNEESMIDCLEE